MCDLDAERSTEPWTRGGEALGGRYLWSPDVLIVREAGVSRLVAGRVGGVIH